MNAILRFLIGPNPTVTLKDKFSLIFRAALTMLFFISSPKLIAVEFGKKIRWVTQQLPSEQCRQSIIDVEGGHPAVLSLYFFKLSVTKHLSMLLHLKCRQKFNICEGLSIGGLRLPCH